MRDEHVVLVLQSGREPLESGVTVGAQMCGEQVAGSGLLDGAVVFEPVQGLGESSGAGPEPNVLCQLAPARDEVAACAVVLEGDVSQERDLGWSEDRCVEPFDVAAEHGVSECGLVAA